MNIVFFFIGVLIGLLISKKVVKSRGKTISRQKDFIMELLLENDRILGLLKYDKKSKKTK